MYSALNYTSAINVVIIQAGVPGVIFALNFIVIRQRTTAAQLIGFVITVLGVGLIVSGGHISRLLGLSLNRGDALMLVAILCYGGFTAALRTKPAMHWLSFIAVIAAAAAIGALPFTYWEYATGTLVAPDLRGLGVIIFAALVPGLTAQALFIRSNELIGANRAGVFFNLVPIFGTLFSVLRARRSAAGSITSSPCPGTRRHRAGRAKAAARPVALQIAQLSRRTVHPRACGERWSRNRGCFALRFIPAPAGNGERHLIQRSGRQTYGRFIPAPAGNGKRLYDQSEIGSSPRLRGTVVRFPCV